MSVDRYHAGTAPQGQAETPPAFPRGARPAGIRRGIERDIVHSTRHHHVGSVTQSGPRAEATR